MKQVKAGEIWICDLGDKNSIIGSEYYGIRPILIVSNVQCCKYSDTIQVLPITSKSKTDLPTHTTLYPFEYKFLIKTSIVCSEGLKTISRQRLKYKLGNISDKQLFEIIEQSKKIFYK